MMIVESMDINLWAVLKFEKKFIYKSSIIVLREVGKVSAWVLVIELFNSNIEIIKYCIIK